MDLKMDVLGHLYPRLVLNAGQGDAPKGASPILGGGVHGCFCVVSALQCVGKRDAWIKEWWQCSVMLASMGRMQGRVMHQKECRLALVNANVSLVCRLLRFFVC